MKGAFTPLAPSKAARSGYSLGRSSPFTEGPVIDAARVFAPGAMAARRSEAKLGEEHGEINGAAVLGAHRRSGRLVDQLGLEFEVAVHLP